MKVVAAFLLLCLATFPAAADQPPKGCAPVYGTWRTAYVMDKFGNPEPTKPPAGIIWEVHIDEDTATVTTHKAANVKFYRWHRYGKNEYEFNGIADNGEYIELGTLRNSSFDYPSDKCYLEVWYAKKIRDIDSLRQRSLMERIK